MGLPVIFRKVIAAVILIAMGISVSGLSWLGMGGDNADIYAIITIVFLAIGCIGIWKEKTILVLSFFLISQIFFVLYLNRDFLLANVALHLVATFIVWVAFLISRRF